MTAEQVGLVAALSRRCQRTIKVWTSELPQSSHTTHVLITKKLPQPRADMGCSHPWDFWPSEL